MRILVTGGAGFIGSHVADHLLGRGHEVAVVDNLSTGKRENVPEGVRFHEADVRSGLGEVFGEFRPEAVAHLAAQMDVRRSVREPAFDADVNVLGTIRLLESCVEHEVRKVVFASTGGAVYGEQREFPAKEDHPQYPVSPYGVSKLAGERYLHYYETQHALSYVVLRYANVYGPRQDPHGEAGVVAIFCGKLLEGGTPTVFGDGLQTRDYVYVGDVVRANLLAAEAKAGEAINIGTGVGTSVLELVESLAAQSESSFEAEMAPERAGEVRHIHLDASRAMAELGWEPEMGLHDGLERTLASLR